MNYQQLSEDFTAKLLEFNSDKINGLLEMDWIRQQAKFMVGTIVETPFGKGQVIGYENVAFVTFKYRVKMDGGNHYPILCFYEADVMA